MKVNTQTNTAATSAPLTSQSEKTTPVTYMIAGRRFIVEPVFKDKEQPSRTVGDILLKLMLES